MSGTVKAPQVDILSKMAVAFSLPAWWILIAVDLEKVDPDHINWSDLFSHHAEAALELSLISEVLKDVARETVEHWIAFQGDLDQRISTDQIDSLAEVIAKKAIKEISRSHKEAAKDAALRSSNS